MEYEQKLRENNQLKKSITDIELKFSKLKNEYDILRIHNNQIKDTNSSTKQIDLIKLREENMKLRSLLATTHDSLESLSVNIRLLKPKVNKSQSLCNSIDDIKAKLNSYLGNSRGLKENHEGSYLENARLKEDMKKLQDENEELKVTL